MHNGKLRQDPVVRDGRYKNAKYCTQHALDGMVNVRNKRCTTQGCGKEPSFGVAGTKTVECCTQHVPDGIINGRNIKCTTEGCDKEPSFGVAGTKMAKYCTQHAQDGMVDVMREICTAKESGMICSFGVAGTKTAEHCAQHNMPRCGVKECRGRGIAPNLSGKDTNGDASPIGSKHKTVHSPPAQASPLSGGSWGSLKRGRYLHNVPTALKRAVILWSTAVARTMPEIEGQKSPIKRNYSVKTGVQVSF